MPRASGRAAERSRMRVQCLLVLALLLASPGAPPAGKHVTLIARWLARDVELYDVTFSRDGTEVGYVQRAHWPDGHEAESMSESTIVALRKRATVEPRFNDPEVKVGP